MMEWCPRGTGRVKGKQREASSEPGRKEASRLVNVDKFNKKLLKILNFSAFPGLE